MQGTGDENESFVQLDNVTLSVQIRSAFEPDLNGEDVFPLGRTELSLPALVLTRVFILPLTTWTSPRPHLEFWPSRLFTTTHFP